MSMLDRILAVGVLAGAIAGAQTVNPPIPKGTNVLFGRVVDIGTEAALAGIVVTITHLTSDPDEAVNAGRLLPARSVMTTADGHFVFRDLPAGRYSISTAAFGYMRNDSPPHIAELKDGDKHPAVTLRLWKHGAISGRIGDEAGDPMPGVAVTAWRRATVAGRLVLERGGIAESDDRGAYRIASLSPGSYIVGVLASSATIPVSFVAQLDAAGGDRMALVKLLMNGGVRTGEGLHFGDVVVQRSNPLPVLSPDGKVLASSTVFFPGSADAAEATVVSIDSGESRGGVDIALRFLPTVRVSGVVTGPDGPLKHVAVRLSPPSLADANDVDPSGVAKAVSDANGKFVFVGVPPGPYIVRSVVMNQATGTTLELALWAQQPIMVGDSDLSNVTLALKPGVRVSGRVEFKGAAAMPRWERPFVVLQPVGVSSWNTLAGSIRADGTFQTGGSDAPGLYEIAMFAPEGWMLQGVSRGGKPLPDSVIAIGAEDVGDVLLTLGTTVTRLFGPIVGPNGAPDGHADAIVFPADTTLWRDGVLIDRRVRRVHATSTGTFEFTKLLPGDYYLAAVSQRVTTDWRDPAFLELLLPNAVKVTLGDGDDKAVPLKTVVLRGR